MASLVPLRLQTGHWGDDMAQGQAGEAWETHLLKGLMGYASWITALKCCVSILQITLKIVIFLSSVSCDFVWTTLFVRVFCNHFKKVANFIEHFVTTWQLALQWLKRHYCWAKASGRNRTGKGGAERIISKAKDEHFSNVVCQHTDMSKTFISVPFTTCAHLLFLSLFIYLSQFSSVPRQSMSLVSKHGVLLGEFFFFCARCACETGRGSVKDSKTRLTSFCVNLCSCCLNVCLYIYNCLWDSRDTHSYTLTDIFLRVLWQQS